MLVPILSSLFLVTVVTAQTGGVFEKAVGPCINDKCPDDNSCYYGQCIPSDIAPEMKVPEKSTAIGSCANGEMCELSTAYCYQGSCYPHPKESQLNQSTNRSTTTD